MAQASRQVRKVRRIKREKSLALKALDIAILQRDQARMIAGALEQELKKYTDDPWGEDTPTKECPGDFVETSELCTSCGKTLDEHTIDVTQIDGPSLTITKVEDEEVGDDVTNV